MLGRTHLLLAALLYAPLLYAFSAQGYLTILQAAALLFGVLLGVLLPDADGNGSKIMRRQKLGLAGAYGQNAKNSAGAAFPIVGYATRYLFYLPASTILSFTSLKDSAHHRGFLHSLLGVALVTLFWGVILGALKYFAVLPLSFSIPLLAGMAGGAMLHLYQDSLTPSGVNWLFPGKAVFRGRIKTGGPGLGRSHSFHESQSFAVVLFLILAGAVSWLALFSSANAFFLAAVSLFALLLIALACGLESPLSQGLLDWEQQQL